MGVRFVVPQRSVRDGGADPAPCTGVDDKLVLHRRAPAFYVGTGTFDGPVLC